MTLTPRQVLTWLMLGCVPYAVGCSEDDDPSPSEETDSSPNEASSGSGSHRDAGEPAANRDAGEPASNRDAGEPASESDASKPDDAEGTDARPALPDDIALPIVFVHGFAGSAQQFDSQAMRFVANGYPAERLYAYEHDGAGFELDSFVAGLDGAIEDMKARFEVDQVYVIGHSRGTSVSTRYLSDPARAEKVAKYIALDGAGCAGISIPCVAPAQTTNTREGQTHPLPGQKHVEVATSKEAFAVQFEFLFDREPDVLDIVKQREPVEISGRAVNFPANTGREGTRLDIWEVDSATGHRRGDEPLAQFDIGTDGAWGPVTVDPEAHYELMLLTPGQEGGHHFYMQHFPRSSAFVRLLSGPPDSDARVNSQTGDDHSNLTVSRMREWTTDDVLEVETRSESGDQPATNVISEDTGSDNIAIYLQDDAASPAESTLGLLPWFPEQPFQTGVDLYMPAKPGDPDGTLTLTNHPRGDADHTQVINVANWSSTEHTISVLFADYPQP